MRGLEKRYMKRGHQRNIQRNKERNKHTSRQLDQNSLKYWLWLSVFYQLCLLSLAIPVLSLAIPGLSLAIPGLTLLVPSQFQDIPDSFCLTFNQKYTNSYNKLTLLGAMIWYIFQKNIWSKRTSCVCVNNGRTNIFKIKTKH